MKSTPSTEQHLITVCSVEDDDFFRAQLDRWLSRNDQIQYLGSYADAETALPNILQKKPNVVLLDYGLPGMKGGELVRHLKEQQPDIRILILTGIPDNSIVFDSLRAGADGFLDKQDYRLSREELFQEICEVHAGNNPLSQRARRLLVEEFRVFKTKRFLNDLLTDREGQVFGLLEKGLSDKEIAQSLHVEECTIKTHAHHIFEKLHVHSRTEAVAKKWGIK